MSSSALPSWLVPNGLWASPFDYNTDALAGQCQHSDTRKLITESGLSQKCCGWTFDEALQALCLNVYFVLSDCCLVHFLFFSLCHGDFHVFKCTAIVVIIIFEIV